MGATDTLKGLRRAAHAPPPGDQVGEYPPWSDAFLRARGRHEQARAALRQAEAELQAAEAALELERLGEREFRRVPERLAIAKAYLAKVPPDPRMEATLAATVEGLKKRVDELGDEALDARDARQRAHKADLTAMREASRPRHRAIVRRIGEALDELMAALDAEADLHAELAAVTAVEGNTGFLDSAAALGLGSRAALEARIHDWSRRCRDKGLV